MRRTLLTLVAVGLVAVAASAIAQGPGKGHGKRGEHKDHITRMIEHRAELGLTDDQILQLESVRDRYVEQNKALREQIHQTIGDRPRPDESLKNMTREERHEAMKKRHEELLAQYPDLAPVFDELKANRDAMRNELHSILTQQQQDKLQELHRERREKARSEGRGRRGQGSKT
jgi:Spy/CpxP family protein refolding chaperone